MTLGSVDVDLRAYERTIGAASPPARVVRVDLVGGGQSGWQGQGPAAPSNPDRAQRRPLPPRTSQYPPAPPRSSTQQPLPPQQEIESYGPPLQDSQTPVYAYRQPELGTELAVAMAAQKSFTGRSFIVWLLYWLFWFPGLIMNIVWLNEASRVKRLVGQSPPGYGCLWTLLIVYLVLPILAVVAFLVVIMFGAGHWR